MKVVYFDPYQQWPAVKTALEKDSRIDFVYAETVPALADALRGAEVLVTGNRGYVADVAMTVREAGTSLEWIEFTTSGIDQALKHGLPAGVAITNAAGLRAFSVAEHAFALMLAQHRGILASERKNAEEKWDRDAIVSLMDNLSGKTLAIIGVGAIGQEIARKAKAFDMTVIGISRGSRTLANFDAVKPRSELVNVCAKADIVLMAAQLEADTSKLLSKDAIGAMKKSAYVVNIARGELIDEEALVAALREGRIAGAALDVVATEPLPAGHALWTLPNVILTPHVGGPGSDGISGSNAAAVASNLDRWINGQPLERRVTAGPT